jgi:iron complex transport system substrate-binding protein
MRPLPLLGLALLLASSGQVMAQTSYPLTTDNCGVEVTLPSAPERVVTIKSTTTEMLLALGLGDRIVGVGFQDGPAPEPWTSAAASLPVLSDKLPSQEVVLEAEPELVYGGWESNFAADGAGERLTLAGLGVATYVSPAACRSIKPAKLTFDAVFAEIAEIGTIFDATPSADALIAEQKTALAAIAADTRGLTALWYSSGTKAPYVGAGSGAPAMMLVWNSAEQKKALLAENPITSQLDAVANQRYLIVPFPASEAGVRNVGATADMAAQLKALDFAE